MYPMNPSSVYTIIEMTVISANGGTDKTFLPQAKCLAIREDNKIYMADLAHCSVRLSSCFHAPVLAIKDRIDGPTRLCYLPKKRLIIVGQFRNPLALIFEDMLEH